MNNMGYSDFLFTAFEEARKEKEKMKQQVQEAKDIIKKAIWYIERVDEFCEPIADESFLFCKEAEEYLKRSQQDDRRA